MTALKAAFQNDPDLVNIDADILPQVFQTLFVCTGCDYISFFSHIGKATFLRYVFQYATFISGKKCKGTLADTDEESCDSGFLAFFAFNRHSKNMPLALRHNHQYSTFKTLPVRALG